MTGGSGFPDSNGYETIRIQWIAGFRFDLDESGPEPSLGIPATPEQTPEQTDQTEKDHETTQKFPVDGS